ncbi:MAG TPA: xanthine dehydrogenase family protein subunit M, partial [Anaerolineae bacterium]|nr:xanthine dehydrogenase family protein subunit M [Anaerolineae bacterium]
MMMWEEYHFAASVEEAVEILARHGDEARLVAGGTDLLVELRKGEMPPRILVDITRLPELREIRQADGRIVLGAGVTFAQILASPLLRAHALPLVEAASTVGSTQIRHLGTLGGNLATASPAGDSLPALMALDARITLAGPQGRRELPLEEFLVGVKRTALAPGELIEKIAFPAMGPETRGAFLKLGLRRAVAIAVVSVAVAVRMDGERVADARIALGAVAPTVIRAREAEESLVGRPLSDETIARAGELAMAAARPIDDIRGSAAYRREMVGVLVRRALALTPFPLHPRLG